MKSAEMPILLLLAVATVASAQSYSLSFQYVDMADGVQLATWTFNPNPPIARGTVLIRSPYNENASMVSQLNEAASYANSYNVVLQLLRGREPSGGDFAIASFGPADTDSTIEWIITQPWSNQKVYTAGASALAIVQYLAPRGKMSQYIKAQFPLVGTAHLHETVYPSGAYMYALAIAWLEGKLNDTAYVETVEQNEPEYWQFWAPYTMVYGRDKKTQLTWWNNVTQPAVHVAGWFDIFDADTLEAFNGYNSSSNGVNGKQYLVVLPTGHCAHGGIIPRPCNTSGYAIARYLADGLFAQMEAGAPLNEPHLFWYVMGSGVASECPGGTSSSCDPGNWWASSQTSWPTTTILTYYLQPGPFDLLHPERLHNNLLTLQYTSNSFAHTYTYHPDFPSITIGGNFFEDPNPAGWDWPMCGTQIQNSSPNMENRDDTVLFTTDVQVAAVLIQGSVTVSLVVSTHTTDTDFVVKITDVFPNGDSYLIQQANQRMRWSDYGSGTSPSCQRWMQHPINITMPPTSWIINTGHRIRLSVASSNYPRYSRNKNNCIPVDQNSTATPAQNTVFSGVASARMWVPTADLSSINRVQFPVYGEFCNSTAPDGPTSVGPIEKLYLDIINAANSHITLYDYNAYVRPHCASFNRTVGRYIDGTPFAVLLGSTEEACCASASAIDGVTAYTFYNYGEAGAHCFLFNGVFFETVDNSYATTGIIATVPRFEQYAGKSITGPVLAAIQNINASRCAQICLDYNNDYCNAYAIISLPDIGPQCFLYANPTVRLVADSRADSYVFLDKTQSTEVESSINKRAVGEQPGHNEQPYSAMLQQIKAARSVSPNFDAANSSAGFLSSYWSLMASLVAAVILTLSW